MQKRLRINTYGIQHWDTNWQLQHPAYIHGTNALLLEVQATRLQRELRNSV